MQFFDIAKSTLSRAIGPQQPNVNFTIGDYLYDSSIWTVHMGHKKDDQTPITVFVFDASKNSSKMALARNALKRAKTLRYPDVLRYVDGAESETKVYIGTEWAEPLSMKDNIHENLIRFGLYKLSVVFGLLSDAQLVHGNLSADAVFVTKSGEFRLWNLEYLSGLKEDAPILLTHGSFMNMTAQHVPPEVRKDSWQVFKTALPHSIDAWAFGCLIHYLFNGKSYNVEDLMNAGKIPKHLIPFYQRLLQENPKQRLSFQKFLEMARKPKHYFDHSFIESSLFLEEIALKSTEEKEEYIQGIENQVAQFPLQFCKYKILPELTKAVEFGGLGAKALKPVIDIGVRLDPPEFELIVAPLLVRLFASSDRGIRFALLENLSKYHEMMPQRDVNDTIFKNLSTGFADNSPLIREQTLKAITVMAPRLDSKIINNAVLRFLAKLQTDPEPGIRTNTIVCLVKIAKFMNDSVKAKILSAAFTKGLHDPFPFAKKAALSGLNALGDVFDSQELAGKLLPNVCPLLVHPDKSIRDQARGALQSFVKRLEDEASKGKFDLPDQPVDKQEQKDGDTWTSWAMNAVTSVATKAASPSDISRDQSQTKPPMQIETSVKTNGASKGMQLKTSSPSSDWMEKSDPVPKSKQVPIKPVQSGWDEWDTNPDSGWGTDPIKPVTTTVKPSFNATVAKKTVNATRPEKRETNGWDDIEIPDFVEPTKPSGQAKPSTDGWEDW
ncbi:armadillo-type protein [Gorgonomyces haynaldii]|nr:armadillo-type protein [Gorgonomyces haynaldii]